MGATRREKVAAREEALAQAAYDVFVERGFEGAAMAEIARRAGVAEGTVYLYFENKHALFRAVLTRFYAALTEAARQGARARAGLRAQLGFLIAHHLEAVMRERKLLALAVILERETDAYAGSLAHQLNRAYVAVFDEVAREAQARGELDPGCDLRLVRDLVYGAIEYAARSQAVRALDPSAPAANAPVEPLLELILHGVASRTPQGPPSSPVPLDLTRLDAVAMRLERLTEQLEATGARCAKPEDTP